MDKTIAATLKPAGKAHAAAAVGKARAQVSSAAAAVAAAIRVSPPQLPPQSQIGRTNGRRTDGRLSNNNGSAARTGKRRRFFPWKLKGRNEGIERRTDTADGRTGNGAVCSFKTELLK